MEPDREKEATDRMSAVESALLILVDRLAMRGAISIDESVDILQVISRSSDSSAARISQSLHLLSQLQRLRGGDGSIAPGSPANGPALG